MKKIFTLLLVLLVSACSHHEDKNVAYRGDNLHIFFDLDSSYVYKFNQDELSVVGLYLKANPEARVRLEGNADDRGAKEYNYILGYERARAVGKELKKYGVDDKQITFISYGKDRPIASKKREISYFKNRRVDLIYEK